jgi:hypothetical protein
MRNKTILLALAAVSAALFALPAVASATPWHLENPTGGFPATGTIAGVGGSSLSTANGETISCTSSSGHVVYENSTTGTLNLKFHGCKGPLGVTCTTSGQPSGTIVTTALPIHNVMLPSGQPGILVTPNAATNNFAHFSCLFVSVTVTGNGVLGKITSPACDTKSTSATVDFNATAHGVQELTQYTGTTYNLKRGEAIAAQDAHATVTLPEATLNCTP